MTGDGIVCGHRVRRAGARRARCQLVKQFPESVWFHAAIASSSPHQARAARQEEELVTAGAAELGKKVCLPPSIVFPLTQ